MEEKFYTVDEVAQMLKVRRQTVYRWMRENNLRWYQVGGHRRIAASDLQAFIVAGGTGSEGGGESEDKQAENGTNNKAALVLAEA